jgi:hypothetical protein
MKPEDHAWRALQNHASAQLRGGFADRVLRVAHGPQPESWRQLQAHAAKQLRPGFAERVLRAAREISGVPSLLDQFAFSLGTAAVCALAVFFFQEQTAQREDERNLASWQQLALNVADDDVRL